MFSVYILKNLITHRLYTGHTENLTRRLQEHMSGQSPYTSKRGPFTLVYSETYDTRSEAIAREKYLKTGKGREELRKILDD